MHVTCSKSTNGVYSFLCTYKVLFSVLVFKNSIEPNKLV